MVGNNAGLELRVYVELLFWGFWGVGLVLYIRDCGSQNNRPKSSIGRVYF